MVRTSAVSKRGLALIHTAIRRRSVDSCARGVAHGFHPWLSIDVPDGTRNRRLAAREGMFHLAFRQMKLVIHRAFGALDITPPGWRGVPAGTIATGGTRGQPHTSTHRGTPPYGGVDSRQGMSTNHACWHQNSPQPRLACLGVAQRAKTDAGWIHANMDTRQC